MSTATHLGQHVITSRDNFIGAADAAAAAAAAAAATITAVWCDSPGLRLLLQ
jgi:hypothetical protein